MLCPSHEEQGVLSFFLIIRTPITKSIFSGLCFCLPLAEGAPQLCTQKGLIGVEELFECFNP